MAQKFDIGLNAKLNDFAKKFGIKRTDNNDEQLFEAFGNYIVGSILLREELDDLKSISTNKAQGVDGIVIIVNDILVSEEADLAKLGEKEDIKIKISFIQSTTQSSFDEAKFSSFVDEAVKFLTKTINIEPYSTIYKKLLDESEEFINRIIETPRISLFFLSARTSHNLSEDKIRMEKNKITQRKELENSYQLDTFAFLQKDEIKDKYEEISKFHEVFLSFENHIQVSSADNGEALSYLATIKFPELKKLILTSDDNLKENLFVENVRAYIGDTPVNSDIEKTLNTKNVRQYFPLLNNGLAIICDKIERHPVKEKEFTLTFPRIINGCQTTNELFKKYKESITTKDHIDDVKVIAKIISTVDNELKKNIIYAANNQNSIDKDLQSLNNFHQEIENYFLGIKQESFQIYFERLRGQYSNVNPPHSKVNIETLARVYISVLLKKPHEMKTQAISKIRTYQKDRIIFNSEKNQPNEYYYCGMLSYWFNHLLVNGNFEMKSKTMDMHILLACNIFLEKEGVKSTEDKIASLTNSKNATRLFTNTVDILNSKTYLHERRGLYSNNKTEKLISELTNATNTTANQTS